MRKMILALSALFAFIASPALAAPYPASWLTKPASFVCDGRTDITARAQADLNNLQAQRVLVLPAAPPGRECITSKYLLLNKSNVAVIGQGKDATIFLAKNRSSMAFMVAQGRSGVFLADFQVKNASPLRPRGKTPQTDCFAVLGGANNIDLSRLKAVDCQAAGFLLVAASDVLIENSDVVGSLADAFHAFSSDRVKMQSLSAIRPGDDCFASIGGATRPSTYVEIIGSFCADGKANGPHFDHSYYGRAIGNHIVRSGGACAAVSTDANWSGQNPSNHILIQGNICDANVTRTELGYGSLSIYSFKSTAALGPDIVLDSNQVRNPTSGPAIRLWGNGKAVASARGNTACGIGSKKLIGITAGTLLERGMVNIGACQPLATASLAERGR